MVTSNNAYKVIEDHKPSRSFHLIDEDNTSEKSFVVDRI